MVGVVLVAVLPDGVRHDLGGTRLARPGPAGQRRLRRRIRATPALTIAYSPEKAVLLKGLAEKFNAKNLRTSDRQPMKIDLVEMTPDEMVEKALAGQATFQAMTPDSSLWLDQLNSRYAQAQQTEPGTHPAAARRRAGALRGHAHRDRRLGEQRQSARLAGQAGGLDRAPDARPAGSELQVEPSEHGARQRPAGDPGRVLCRRGRAARPDRRDGAGPQRRWTSSARSRRRCATTARASCR